MKKNLKKSVNRLQRNKSRKRIIKIVLLILLLILIISYIVGSIIFNRGQFTISLERDLYLKNNLIIYDDPNYKVFRTELYAPVIDFIDNIAEKWLPSNLGEHPGGSHNGDNYIAYTFFIENMGELVTNYWTEIVIADVIKNVDEALRVRVYKNETVNTYAKIGKGGRPEKGTIPFKTGTVVVDDKVSNFRPGDINKYTIVIWIEGNDPECTDNILGGEVKVYMDFKSELIEE